MVGTTLPNNIMKQISDIVEQDLIDKKIFYLRDNTLFSVEPHNMEELLKSQVKANKILIDRGVITKKMIFKEVFRGLW